MANHLTPVGRSSDDALGCPRVILELFLSCIFFFPMSTLSSAVTAVFFTLLCFSAFVCCIFCSFTLCFLFCFFLVFALGLLDVVPVSCASGDFAGILLCIGCLTVPFKFSFLDFKFSFLDFSCFGGMSSCPSPLYLQRIGEFINDSS